MMEINNTNNFVNVRDEYNIIGEMISKQITNAQFDKKYIATIASTPLNGYADIRFNITGTLIPQVKMRVGLNAVYGNEVFVTAINNNLTNLFIDAKKVWNDDDWLNYLQINDYNKDIDYLVTTTGNDNNEGRFISQIGTVSVVSGTKNVVGVGTTLNDLVVGNYILVNGEPRKIFSVIDPLNLTVTENFDTSFSGVFSYCDNPKLTLESVKNRTPKKNGKINVYIEQGDYSANNLTIIDDFVGNFIYIKGDTKGIVYAPAIQVSNNGTSIEVYDCKFKVAGDSSGKAVVIENSNIYMENVEIIKTASIPVGKTQISTGVEVLDGAFANIEGIVFTNNVPVGIHCDNGGNVLVNNGTGTTIDAYISENGSSLTPKGTFPIASNEQLTELTGGRINLDASDLMYCIATTGDDANTGLCIDIVGDVTTDGTTTITGTNLYTQVQIGDYIIIGDTLSDPLDIVFSLITHVNPNGLSLTARDNISSIIATSPAKYCRLPKLTLESVLTRIPNDNGNINIINDVGNYDSGGQDALLIEGFVGKNINLWLYPTALGDTYLPPLWIRNNNAQVTLYSPKFKIGDSINSAGITVENSFVYIFQPTFNNTTLADMIMFGLYVYNKGTVNIQLPYFKDTIYKGIYCALGGNVSVTDGSGDVEYGYFAGKGGIIYASTAGGNPTATISLYKTDDTGIVSLGNGSVIPGDITLSGDVSVISSGSTITGVSTSFTEELYSGCRVMIGSDIAIIHNIGSDTTATIYGTFTATLNNVNGYRLG